MPDPTNRQLIALALLIFFGLGLIALFIVGIAVERGAV